MNHVISDRAHCNIVIITASFSSRWCDVAMRPVEGGFNVLLKMAHAAPLFMLYV